MNILVCGDRKWDDRKLMYRVLKEIRKEQENMKSIVTLIHGDDQGADKMAEDIAFKFIKMGRAWKVKAFPANRDKYGKAAGPRRNAQMLKAKPDIVLAFHNDLTKSKRTKNMINHARAAKIPVKIFSHDMKSDYALLAEQIMKSETKAVEAKRETPIVPKFTQITTTEFKGQLVLFGLTSDGRVYEWIEDRKGDREISYWSELRPTT